MLGKTNVDDAILEAWKDICSKEETLALRNRILSKLLLTNMVETLRRQLMKPVLQLVISWVYTRTKIYEECALLMAEHIGVDSKLFPLSWTTWS